MSPVKSIWVGLRRHRTVFVRRFLEIFGAIWLALESASFFSAPVKLFTEGNHWLLLAALVAALCGALWRAREPTEVVVHLRHTNTEIGILFGDLFGATGDHLVIPVNDGFDGALGVTVDPKSVHGQFVQNLYNGSRRDFEAACDKQLAKSATTPSGRKDRKLSYPIGTTAAVHLEGRKGFLFALSRTDAVTHKAHCDVGTMWAALGGLWQCVRYHSNGHAVRLPLVGAGQSGVGVEPRHLLRLILLSILVATREREVSKRINIVLHPDLFEKIDLRGIKNDWS